MSSLMAAALGALVGAALVTIVFLVRQMRLAGETARLTAELEGAERALDDQRALVSQTQIQLREAFGSLSKDALKDNRADFVQHAENLLSPVRETLARVQTQLAQVDNAREGSYRAVHNELGVLRDSQEQLRKAADDLTRSLRSPNVRGKWGEVQLKRIVELAGMIEHCDFVEKETATTENGSRQQPDLVVKLPGEATIVIDSKVPIDAYLAATGAKDGAARDAQLAAHVRQMRDHIRTLGAKEYWKQFQPSPEFVVMFLPLEPLLQAAFEHDDSLLEYASSVGVVPATPMTLLGLLKAIASGWKQQQLAKNAEEIQQIGRDLYDRLSTMLEHLEGVGRGIKGAADSYDRFVGSLETKVLPGARRFKELGVSSAKEMEIPDQLSLSMRRVIKEELTGQPPSDDLVKIERLN
ncbi:MAG TPA: DNA recombination protein RmuC [Vicinamibacterales bacterium]|nr:DNA recombination protein RmuC [Vicinamibacterales bacterium]